VEHDRLLHSIERLSQHIMPNLLGTLLWLSKRITTHFIYSAYMATLPRSSGLNTGSRLRVKNWTRGNPACTSRNWTTCHWI